jgi:hypothetical protein
LPVALDEFPIHQAPLSLEQVASSDRNFYDRCYFNAHDRTGEIFFVTGLAVYRNLGVTDAFALVRKGTLQWTVKLSDAFSHDRTFDQRIGPYHIEVIEPLQRIRIICDADEHGIGFDLTWDGSFPAVEEQRHLLHAMARPVLDTYRFAQVGTWSGTLRVDGETHAVDPATWIGTRDRSWGIRPVGEPEPHGRAAEERDPGIWWLYVPLRFDDHALIVMAQERTDGYRTLNDAVRVWSDGHVEQLGWPEVDIVYRSGTRIPERAKLHLVGRDRKPIEVDIESLGGTALHVGAGYGTDPEWNHGQWMGRDWIKGSVYDLTDPDVKGRIPFGVIDHVARATCDGAVGWGLFEHATIGRHLPSGFTDFDAVAP